MRYDPTGNNLGEVPRHSSQLAELLRRKAAAGADYWRTNSVVDTGYNASHVQVLQGRNPDTGAQQAIIYASGYYAKWREIGSSRAGPRAPERVLLRARPIIRDA